jgi:molybdenum cofactor cytidylyltransferase
MVDSSSQKIALLLMAAGSSSRLGQPKQLVEINESDCPKRSLLHRQISVMETICDALPAKANCVLGFEYEAMSQHVLSQPYSTSVNIIHSQHWHEGLSTSIASGICSLDDDVSAVLIFLVDQWQLTTKHLSILIKQWQQAPNRIVMASQGNLSSPPVIFPKAFFNDLKAMSGDAGAKKVIKENSNQVKLIDLPEAFIDLDTPEQLQTLQNMAKSK